MEFQKVWMIVSHFYKVALLPLTSHGHLIGHIVFIPEALQANTHSLFQVPPNFNGVTGEHLTAAIILWTLQHHTPHLRPFKTFPQRPSTHIPNTKHQENFLQARRKFVLAIQMLGFPHKLYEFFHDTVKDRTFSIWWKTPNDSESSALETSMLKDILETTYGRHVGYEKNARVMFVHVSSLETIHMIPKLVNRRQGYPRSVQFYTYGTSEVIPKVFWGIQEIYPCGMMGFYLTCSITKIFIPRRSRYIYTPCFSQKSTSSNGCLEKNSQAPIVDFLYSSTSCWHASKIVLYGWRWRSPNFEKI